MKTSPFKALLSFVDISRKGQRFTNTLLARGPILLALVEQETDMN